MRKQWKTAESEADERKFWEMVFEIHQASGLSISRDAYDIGRIDKGVV